MAYIGQNADGNFTTSVSKDTFSGNGSTTSFTLSEGATTNTVDVFVENIRQEPTTAYTVDGTTLTFTAAPVSGTDNIYVVNRGPIQLSASHPAAQALTAYSATITTDLTVDTDTLVVDSTNNRVGIGTSSPSATLDVEGSSNSTYLTVGGDDSSNGRALTFTSSASAAFNGAVHTINAPSSQGVIALSTSSTERMRIDSSGNLLVGTTDDTPYNNSAGSSADNGLVVSAGRIWAARYSGTPMELNRTSDDGDIANFRKDGTVVGSIGTASGYPYFAAPANFSVMLVTNDVRPRTNTGTSNNDNTVNLGVSSSRFKDLYLGGSVYLGGTGSANALDDYEEGSWTPNIIFGSTAATTTVTRARYIKVGSLVSLSATITCASTPASGSMVIANIPFTPNVNVETTGNVMCNNVNTETGTVNLVTYHYNLNNTNILVYGTRDNSTWYNFTNSHVSSGDQFIFTHTYYIS